MVDYSSDRRAFEQGWRGRVAWYVFCWILVLIAVANSPTLPIRIICERRASTPYWHRSVHCFERVLKLPRSYFDNTPIGVTLSRLTSDLETIGETFIQSVVGWLKTWKIINTIALLIMMLFVQVGGYYDCADYHASVMYPVYVRNRLARCIRLLST